MVAMQVQRLPVVPIERHLIRLEPEPETLGMMLRRLRAEYPTPSGRELTQPQLAAMIDPERASDVQAMKNLQALLSRYESDSIKRPDPVLLAKLEAVYGLPEDTLALASIRASRQSRNRPGIPPNSIVISPAEPEFIEAVRALFLLEPEDLPDAAALIRTRALGPLPRPSLDEEAAS